MGENMTKRLSITAAQVTAICNGAAKAGFIAEVEMEGVKIRLIPENMATVTEATVSRNKGRGYL